MCDVTVTAAQDTAAPAPLQAIVGGNVVDLDRGVNVADAVIVISGDRVQDVGPSSRVSVPAGASVIRADGKWLLSGLMDMHVHLGLLFPGSGVDPARESEASLVLRMVRNAKASLLAGVTTVRLIGEFKHADFALKRAVDRGEFPGPRIYTAGMALLPTGGHGNEVFPDYPTVDGAAAVIAFTRRQLHAGASWIKLMISKGVLDQRGDIAAADMTIEEMRAAVEIAHAHGAKVAVHTGSPLATRQALEAGVDSFEHGYFLEEADLREIEKHGKWYVPTMVVTQAGAQEFYRKVGAPPYVLERAKSVARAHWRAMQSAIKVGVQIAMGTDQFPFEPNEGTVAAVRETELYVEAGMTPLQALRASMVDPARMLGADKDLGSIAAGKYADLIAVTADPLADIRALRTIGLVMKGGVVVRNDWLNASVHRPSNASI